MSRAGTGREGLLSELDDVLRDIAGRAVLVHQAIAERFGLNPTDLKCLDLARHVEELTAGRLAEITGMSTSAITAVLDRMEGVGFIERRRDPRDRRKVVVVSTGRREAETTRAYAPLRQAVRAALARYDDGQLALLLDMIREVGLAAASAAGSAGPAVPAVPAAPRRHE
jgi:DNA-binding MarR family transcriptional regulator